MKDVMTSAQESADRQIEAILTAEQKVVFADLQAKQKERSPQTTGLVNRLDLTEDQARKVEAIVAKRNEDMEKLHDQKGNGRQKMKEMRAIMDKSDREIEALLTEKQKLEFEQLKAERQSQQKGQKGNGRRGGGQRGGGRRGGS